MKYEINLLPPPALAERMNIIKKRRQKTIFWSVLVSCTILLSSYGAIWWGLQSLRNSVSDEIFSRNNDKASIIEGVQKLNKEIVLLDQRVSSYTVWTAHIPDIVLAAPQGILISRLELVEETETFVVTGTATHGSAVVVYQLALEQLPWVDRVVAPLQNFARAPEAKVTFTIFHKKPTP